MRDAQIGALQRLLPAVAALPALSSAEVRNGLVPVITLSACVPDFRPPPAGKCAAYAGGLLTLHVDVSIGTSRHRGMAAARRMHAMAASLAPLAPLVAFLKALLHKQGLNTPATGGLSSYSLVVMVSAWLLSRPASARSAPQAAVLTSLDEAHGGGGSRDGNSGGSVADSGSRGDSHVNGFGGGTDGGGSSGSTAASNGELLLELLTYFGTVFDPKRHAVLAGAGLECATSAGYGPRPAVLGTGGFVARGALRSLLLLSLSPSAKDGGGDGGGVDGGGGDGGGGGGGGNGGGGGSSGGEHTKDPFKLDPLVCVDPLAPANNLGRNCYRISLIQTKLAAAVQVLRCAAEQEALLEGTDGDEARVGAAATPLRRAFHELLVP